MIYSISLPILLLGLALPETRGRLFLSRRKLMATYAFLGVDVLVLFLFVLRGEQFWMGWPVFLGSFLATGVLVLAARWARSDLLHARNELPKIGPRRLAISGVAFFPSVLVSQFVVKDAGAPPVLDFFWVVVLQVLWLAYVFRVIGSRGNEKHLVALAFGLVVPIAALGVIAEAQLPFTLVADVVMVLFFRKLWHRVTAEGASS